MKPINLTSKYRTRSGLPARVHRIDLNGTYPVLASISVGLGERVGLHLCGGQFHRATESHLDLIEIVETITYTNVYEDGGLGDKNHSKADAVAGRDTRACVGVLRVTVTDGVGAVELLAP